MIRPRGLRHTASVLIYMFDSDDRYVEPKQHIISTDVLVVDEIGLLSRRTFEILEEVCRTIRGSDYIFENLQVIGCGDFRQLPPVPNIQYGDNGSYCFESDLFRHAFPHFIHLTQVMRQKEEDLAVAILELCSGNPSAETEGLVKSLERPLGGDTTPTHIFASNFDVDYLNQQQLDSLQEAAQIYVSIDKGLVGQACSPLLECLVAQSECGDGKCRCERGYSFSSHDQTCTKYCHQHGDTFQSFKDTSHDGHNFNILQGITRAECEQICIDQVSPISTTYEIFSMGCYIQAEDGSEFPNDFSANAGNVYYERNCG